MENERISRRRLSELVRLLSERDRDILQSLQKCRYLSTNQIQQLHFTDSASHSAALRASNRGLIKLQDFGLIGALKRRIGGVRAGSGAAVWHLSTPGAKLLDMSRKGGSDDDTSPTKPPTRKRAFEPSTQFLAHTLAVSEAYVQLTIMGRGKEVDLLTVELEPECWRSYKDNGKLAALKPDIFVTTAAGEYEDDWYIELDLATEAPCKILEKCQRYLVYYRTGIEQQRRGVFPCVVWVVPDTRRKERLQEYIKEALTKQPDVFLVITPDELEPLIRNGAAQYKTNLKGVQAHE